VTENFESPTALRPAFKEQTHPDSANPEV
jgi:hypothetical protein